MKKQLSVASGQWTRGRLSVLLLAFLICGLTHAVQAQKTDKPPQSDPLSGKYEGMIKSSAGVDSRLTLEVNNEQGKLSGRLVTPQGATSITKGSFHKGKLSMKLGDGKTASTLTAKLQDDKLIGNWKEGKNKYAVELKRVPVVVETASTPQATPAPTPVADPPATVAPVTADPISLTGEWDGLADAQGQGFPFVLTLKVEGEKVTGESNSSLGHATISNGVFKDGKLAFQLDSQSGAIIMSAVLKDGGLVGEFDYAGQAQGRWVAKKRNP